MIGIPYRGSKRQIAAKIVDKILADNPKCRHFYDLFGGGGAVSFEALQRSQIERVYYNELNAGVVALLEKIKSDGVTDEFFDWVSREEFNALKSGDSWRSGLIKTCWSFGNNQRDYIYGKDIESLKKEMHDHLMRGGYDYSAKSRIALIADFISKIQASSGGAGDPQKLQHLLGIERLHRAGHLDRMAISCASFDVVAIESDAASTVIYLDPPYSHSNLYQNKVIADQLVSYIKIARTLSI
jgi:16S rRNA G966 N2-methylase RsmD